MAHQVSALELALQGSLDRRHAASGAKFSSRMPLAALPRHARDSAALEQARRRQSLSRH